jgi:hypothetical protein
MKYTGLEEGSDFSKEMPLFRQPQGFSGYQKAFFPSRADTLLSCGGEVVLIQTVQ